ncbi:hypothetical protein [uncultured Bacteroides sp.]|uniref:hypothetical protein n=1 Tax=uncultured Bacteroides sp. TaxID=162156 RepID=UPI00267022F9|nr:hypothetical protein [uncultured Bacteroides sp.]
MKILYIGEKKTHSQYQKGKVPSHWLYGAVEMERDGHEVIWEQENKSPKHDLTLIRHYDHDIVFIPNLNLHSHFYLLLLAAIGLYRKPIYAYLHREPAEMNGWRGKVYKLLLHGLKHVFFLSTLTMEQVIKNGMATSERCSVPGWGPDMDFFAKVPVSDNGYFVSTGKENRDFDTLIEAFRITGKPLHILTSTYHNGTDYSDLEEKTRGIPNIRISLVDNSPTNYDNMLMEMAAAHALVCPLRRDKLTYCVGLSTIADAEGLRKKLIITDNPYHSGRNDAFFRVKSVEDWVEAINAASSNSHREQMHFSMSDAYDNMKKIMKL